MNRGDIMLQFDYCKNCHEVFEIKNNFGLKKVVSGQHKQNCQA